MSKAYMYSLMFPLPKCTIGGVGYLQESTLIKFLNILCMKPKLDLRTKYFHFGMGNLVVTWENTFTDLWEVSLFTQWILVHGNYDFI